MHAIGMLYNFEEAIVKLVSSSQELELNESLTRMVVETVEYVLRS